jgi:hypothetical protein
MLRGAPHPVKPHLQFTPPIVRESSVYTPKLRSGGFSWLQNC